MKRTLLLIFIAAAFAAAGCTSPEQDQKIRLFWMQQYSNLMLKSLGKMYAGQKRPSLAGVPARERRPATRTPETAQQPLPQLMDVTIETDALPGQAPYAERVRMKRAWDAVQLSNQKTLDDIHTTFGEQVKAKAFLITANTEKQLKQAAKNATDFAAYFIQQKEMLAKQNQSITALMTQNRGSIRQLKKKNTSL